MNDRTLNQDVFFVLREKLRLESHCDGGISPHDSVELLPGTLITVPAGVQWHNRGSRWEPRVLHVSGFKEPFKGSARVSRDNCFWQHILLGPFSKETLDRGLWIAQGSMGQTPDDWKMKLQSCGNIMRIPLKRDFIKKKTEFCAIVSAEVCLHVLSNGLYEVAATLNISQAEA